MAAHMARARFTAEVAAPPQNAPLTILHLLNDVDETGCGIVNVAVDLAVGQAQLGHRVAVASSGGKYVAILEAAGIRHHVLDQRRRPGTLLQAARRFRRLVAELDPDIVHCHMVTGVLLARSCRAGSRYRLVAHLHNVGQKRSRLMGLADCVVTVSEGVADFMSRHGIAQRKLRVVVNGPIGTLRWPARDGGVAPLARPAIVTVAGMYENKGIGELIAAFARVAALVPEAHLYLVGDGPDRASFEIEAAKTAASARIRFVGFQHDPRPYLRAADIFVLASHRESFGMAIIEARENGCAVIASDVDGIPEALDRGAAGMLVPPRNVGALAAAMLALLRDEALRRSWQGKAARGLERFGVESMARDVIAAYRGLATSRQRP
jgi:glycosyltransferase involved in cell wall biosynthesis